MVPAERPEAEAEGRVDLLDRLHKDLVGREEDLREKPEEREWPRARARASRAHGASSLQAAAVHTRFLPSSSLTRARVRG